VQQLQSSSETVVHLYRGFDAVIERNSAIRLAAQRGESDFTRLNMSDETGTGRWDVLRLYEDLLVCVADSYYRDRFTFDVSPPVNLISMRFVMSGALQLLSRRECPVAVEASTASMVTVPAVRDHSVSIKGGERLASLTLHFHSGKLASFINMDEEEPPSLLRDFIRDAGSLRYCAVPLTPAMKSGVLDIIDAPFAGTLRRRYLEAKVTELLCLFFGSVAQDCERGERVTPVLHSDRERLYHAREILCASFFDPPTISALARAVGTNRTKLQSGFKETFGVTIFEFCHSRRMVRARELLHDHGLSIGEVATAVGYDHPTNFTAAFRRYFKQPPKQMRRSGKHA